MTEICPRFEPGPWTFTGECDWEKHEDRTCQYCGSLHPDVLMARIEAGDVRISATDKNYKLYVSNAGGVPFKQTFRNCPPKADCTYENCTHWVTRERDTAKFYFQHLSIEQRKRFVDLFNEGKLPFEEGDAFYVWPFFMRRAV